MLGLWSLGSPPDGLSLHVAFRTSLNVILAARSPELTRRHTLSFFGTETAEPSVIGWMPAATVSHGEARLCSQVGRVP